MATNALAGYYSPDMANANLLASYGVRPDYASQISPDPNQRSYDLAMSGNYPLTPEQAQSYVIQAMAKGDTAGAQGLMQKYGITQDQVNAQLASTPGRFGDGALGSLFGGIKNAVQPIGQYVTDHPAALFAAPFIAAGALGAFGGSLGAGGSATGFGTGTATATDTAFGALPEAAGAGSSDLGAMALGATEPAAGAATGAAGWGPAFGTIGAGPPAAGGSGFLSSLVPGAARGSNMGLGLADWLNIGNTVLGAVGANRAANTVSNATDAATAEQARQYDLARSDLAPYRTAGTTALGNLADPNASFQASPDYAFRRSEGQRDIGNSFAARGGAFSGNALRALTDYNSNLASGEFGNWWNRQAGLAGVGQAATGQGNILGANYAGQVGQNIIGGANARASGIQNTAGILAGGAANTIGNYLYRLRQPVYGGYGGGYSPYVGYGG